MAASSSSSSRWPTGKIGIGKTLPQSIYPPLINLKDPWAADRLGKLQNGFHVHMKQKAYVQQVCANVGSLGEKTDSECVGSASFINNFPEELKPGVVAMGDLAAQKILFEKLKEAGVTELPAREQRWQKSAIFPIRKETTEGPLSHLPETQGVGFIGSTIRYCIKWLESAKHFTAHRFRKCLEEKGASNLNYFDPSMLEDKFSDDRLGNMQRRFVILSELYPTLCQIAGDTSWFEKKEAGVEDNINSITARVMAKLHECRVEEYIGGTKTEGVQAALRALSPIAKPWEPPHKDPWTKPKELNIAEEFVGWMDQQDAFTWELLQESKYSIFSLIPQGFFRNPDEAQRLVQEKKNYENSICTSKIVPDIKETLTSPVRGCSSRNSSKSFRWMIFGGFS